jgi:hypothetical protein
MKVQVWFANNNILSDSTFYRDDGRIFNKISVCQNMREGNYILIKTIEVENLEDAFERTQNFDNPWNHENPCRSSCVGDLFKIEGEHRCKFYILGSVGFDKVKII